MGIYVKPSECNTLCHHTIHKINALNGSTQLKKKEKKNTNISCNNRKWTRVRKDDDVAFGFEFIWMCACECVVAKCVCVLPNEKRTQRRKLINYILPFIYMLKFMVCMRAPNDCAEKFVPLFQFYGGCRFTCEILFMAFRYRYHYFIVFNLFLFLPVSLSKTFY